MAEMESYLDAVIVQLTALVQKSLEKTAEEMVEDIKQSIDEDPPPSSPGQPPHRQTGRLHEGVYFDKSQVSTTEAEVTVVSSREADRAGTEFVPVFMEFGTGAHVGNATGAGNKITSKDYVQAGLGVAPRPYFGPAIERWTPRFVENLAKDLKMELK
jgi:hypothetical protein